MALKNFNGRQAKPENYRLSTSVAFSIWWCLWTPLYISILQNFGVATKEAITDGLISNTLLAAICAFVINNMRYYLPKKEKYLYVLIMSSALSAVWLVVVKLILKTIFKGDEVYLPYLQQTSVLRYTIAFLLISCNTLLSLLWYTQKEQQEETERKADMERTGP